VTTIERVEHLSALRSESARFADLVAAIDLDAPVPSCPAWSARDLFVHLGRVQRFWAANVRAGDPERPDRSEGDPDAPSGDLPADEDLSAWVRAGTASLLDALEQSDEDGPCWTWWEDPRTCGAVARHQVQEAAVHRWDAEVMLGRPAPLPPDLADDGVSEFLEIVAADDATTLLGSLTLEAIDTGSRWIVGDQRGPKATVRASASDLVLLLYGRLPASVVSVDGERGVLAAFLDAGDTE
jgi:uncharacterized protein (TIGR03083 family)